MTDEDTDRTTSSPSSPRSAGAGVGSTAPATNQTPTKVGKRQLPQVDVDVTKIRMLLAKLIWAVCVFFALILAAEVLLIAIEANDRNDLAMFVRETAEKVDLGLFSLSDPIKDFNPRLPNFSDTGTALFNYGLAAVIWLVVGRIADSVIRP